VRSENAEKNPPIVASPTGPLAANFPISGNLPPGCSKLQDHTREREFACSSAAQYASPLGLLRERAGGRPPLRRIFPHVSIGFLGVVFHLLVMVALGGGPGFSMGLKVTIIGAIAPRAPEHANAGALCRGRIGAAGLGVCDRRGCPGALLFGWLTEPFRAGVSSSTSR